MVHSVILLEERSGTTVGLIEQTRWCREKGSRGKRHKRKERAYEDKESFKWERASRRVTARLGEVMGRVISVCDREADVYEYLGYKTRCDERYVVRSSWDRRVKGEWRRLNEELANAPKLGEETVKVEQRGGRRVRTAQLELRACRVRLRAPKRLGGAGEIEVNAVLAQEYEVPEGENGLCWLLLSSESIESLSAVRRVLRIYRMRWRVEEFHKAWKSGAGVEQRRIAAALGADAELSKLGLLRARFLQGGRREVISGLDGLASTHREAALLRGDVLTALGRLEQAEVAFTTLLDSNPKDIKALHGLARIGLERGDFDFAKKTLETAQSLSTVSVTGWLLQADVAFRTQEFGQARAAFEEALLRQPDHFGARVGLVRSLLELREPAATKSHLDELHQISPQMPLVNYLRGVAAAQLGEPALAQEALLSTLRVARHHVDARTLLASIFYQQGQMEEAKEAILQVLRRPPGHVASRKLLAAVYIASGRFGDAITSLEVALDSAPGDAELLAMLGQAYLGKGLPDDARWAFELASARAPEANDITMGLASSYFQLGNDEAALRELRGVIERDPTFVQAPIALVNIHLQRGESEEALELATAQSEKWPDNPAILNLVIPDH